MAQQLNAKTVTAADVLAGKTTGWCYSDAFKEIHGFRPRGEYWNTPEMEASFWNTFEEEMDRVFDEEQDHLRALGEEHGRIFQTFTMYYNFWEAEREREWAAAEAAEKVAQAERAEFNRRGSPAPTLEAWYHGDRLAA